MRNTLLILLLMFGFQGMAQVKINQVPPGKKVVVKNLPSTPAKKKLSTGKPPLRYEINRETAARLGVGLLSKTTTVNGKKITSTMVAVNSPQLTSPKTAKASGISQKIRQTGTSSNNGQYCQTFSVKVSANSENFDVPYGTQASNIYPGAAYMYDEYYKNTVSPTRVTFPRHPIYLQVSSSSGNGKFELVQDPGYTTLNAAVGSLKSSLPSGATNESTSINMVSVFDQADFYLKVNGGGGGFGFKADASFEIATNSKKSYFMIDATQTFFTINAMLPDTATGGFFRDPVHNSKKDALFMASVSYGRRVLGVVETEFKDEKMAANFKVSYSSGFAGGYAGLDMINGMVSQTTKVKLYFVGGDAATITIPNATEASVRDAINSYLRKATNQNAVPIKFTFRNMAMSGMRYESATDNFTYQQCVPIAPELQYDVNINLMMIENSKNEEVKFGISQFAHFYKGNSLVPSPTGPTAPLLCWKEVGEPFKTLWKAEPPRNFTRSTQVNRSVTYRVSQGDILNGDARVELLTDYIAMYATKVLGSTNDSNPKKLEKVFIKDVITSSGHTMTKDIQINFNGRVFTIKFVIKAIPV
jgi:hypothetical protein